MLRTCTHHLYKTFRGTQICQVPKTIYSSGHKYCNIFTGVLVDFHMIHYTWIIWEEVAFIWKATGKAVAIFMIGTVVHGLRSILPPPVYQKLSMLHRQLLHHGTQYIVLSIILLYDITGSWCFHKCLVPKTIVHIVHDLRPILAPPIYQKPSMMRRQDLDRSTQYIILYNHTCDASKSA